MISSQAIVLVTIYGDLIHSYFCDRCLMLVYCRLVRILFSPFMMQTIEKLKWLINVVFAVYGADNRETKMVD